MSYCSQSTVDAYASLIMSDAVNPRCVALEFLKLVEEEFNFDERKSPNHLEVQIASLLFTKFNEITHTYSIEDSFQDELDWDTGKYLHYSPFVFFSNARQSVVK